MPRTVHPIPSEQLSAPRSIRVSEEVYWSGTMRNRRREFTWPRQENSLNHPQMHEKLLLIVACLYCSFLQCFIVQQTSEAVRLQGTGRQPPPRRPSRVARWGLLSAGSSRWRRAGDLTSGGTVTRFLISMESISLLLGVCENTRKNSDACIGNFFTVFILLVMLI